jgi:hypothetical protein
MFHIPILLYIILSINFDLTFFMSNIICSYELQVA